MYIRIVSLLLAFCLGFAVCAGSLFFGALTVAKNFKVRDLERNNIIDLPDELIFGEDPVVDLLDLSLLQFIDEYNEIKGFGDKLTIETLRERYAIKIHHDIDAVLSDEVKNTPLPELFSVEGFNKIIGSVYIGNIERYTIYNADGTEGHDPKAEGAHWYTNDGTMIVGIEDIIADFSLQDFLNGNINTDTLFDTVTIGDIFGYTHDGDNWYDADGNRVTGVISAFAGFTIHNIGTNIDDIEIGAILGYQKNDDGKWCTVDEETGELTEVTGVMSVFADSNIHDIGEDIQGAELGKLLGYSKRDDGTWYKLETDPETGEEKEVNASGIIAAFADSQIDDIGSKLEESRLGELLGYTEGDDGSWYKTEKDSETGEEKQVKVTGAMAIFANSNINGIGDEIEKSELGKLLGYTKGEDGNWYKTEIDSETGEEKQVKVTGAMAVFANSGINGIGDEIEKTEVGKLLGYELVEGVWYELDENGDRIPVDGFMSKISNSTINNMGGVFDTLVIGDIVKAEDRETGIFAIIEPETKIDEIGSAVNDSIKNSPLQFFINEGLITFQTGDGEDDDMTVLLDGASAGTNDYKKFRPTDDDFNTQKGYYEGVWKEGSDADGVYYQVPAWRTQPLTSSFGYIIKLITTPVIP